MATKISNRWLEIFGWAKHLAILGKCKDSLEREFYIRMTKKFG